jgi:8-oxo-dGTP diphosphatase
MCKVDVLTNIVYKKFAQHPELIDLNARYIEDTKSEWGGPEGHMTRIVAEVQRLLKRGEYPREPGAVYNMNTHPMRYKYASGMCFRDSIAAGGEKLNFAKMRARSHHAPGYFMHPDGQFRTQQEALTALNSYLKGELDPFSDDMELVIQITVWTMRSSIIISSTSAKQNICVLGDGEFVIHVTHNGDHYSPAPIQGLMPIPDPSPSNVVLYAHTQTHVLMVCERDGKWGFPGGKVDPGERPTMACVREVQEELGVKLDIPDPQYSWNCHTSVCVMPVLAQTDIQPNLQNAKQPLEVSEWKWVQKSDLKSFELRKEGKFSIPSIVKNLCWDPFAVKIDKVLSDTRRSNCSENGDDKPEETREPIQPQTLPDEEPEARDIPTQTPKPVVPKIEVEQQTPLEHAKEEERPEITFCQATPAEPPKPKPRPRKTMEGSDPEEPPIPSPHETVVNTTQGEPPSSRDKSAELVKAGDVLSLFTPPIRKPTLSTITDVSDESEPEFVDATDADLMPPELETRKRSDSLDSDSSKTPDPDPQQNPSSLEGDSQRLEPEWRRQADKTCYCCFRYTEELREHTCGHLVCKDCHSTELDCRDCRMRYADKSSPPQSYVDLSLPSESVISSKTDEAEEVLRTLQEALEVFTMNKNFNSEKITLLSCEIISISSSVVNLATAWYNGGPGSTTAIIASTVGVASSIVRICTFAGLIKKFSASKLMKSASALDSALKGVLNFQHENRTSLIQACTKTVIGALVAVLGFTTEGITSHLHKMVVAQNDVASIYSAFTDTFHSLTGIDVDGSKEGAIILQEKLDQAIRYECVPTDQMTPAMAEEMSAWAKDTNKFLTSCLKSEKTSILTQKVATVMSLLSKYQAHRAARGSAFAPICIYLKGDPGHGKTECARYLSKRIALRFGLTEEAGKLYEISAGNYFSPYYGNRICLIDELGAGGGRNQGMANCAMGPVLNTITSAGGGIIEGASLAEKGQRSNFALVFFTSNKEIMESELGLANEARIAFASRMSVNYVVVDPQYNPNVGRHRQNHRQPDFSHLRFQARRTNGNGQVPNARLSQATMTIQQVEDDIVQRIIQAQVAYKSLQTKTNDDVERATFRGEEFVLESGSAPKVAHIFGAPGTRKTYNSERYKQAARRAGMTVVNANASTDFGCANTFYVLDDLFTPLDSMENQALLKTAIDSMKPGSSMLIISNYGPSLIAQPLSIAQNYSRRYSPITQKVQGVFRRLGFEPDANHKAYYAGSEQSLTEYTTSSPSGHVDVCDHLFFPKALL